jgi:hypothetical protein
MAMTENGWGKERKRNGGSATANQVRDRWKELKQKCLQTESAIKKLLITQPLQRAYRQILTLYGNHVFTLHTYRTRKARLQLTTVNLTAEVSKSTSTKGDLK